MKSVSTTEARARFGALLAEVTAGESFVITSHGRPVAVLAPAAPRRRFGQWAGLVQRTHDFDAPMEDDELRLWGEPYSDPAILDRCPPQPPNAVLFG